MPPAVNRRPVEDEQLQFFLQNCRELSDEEKALLWARWVQFPQTFHPIASDRAECS